MLNYILVFFFLFSSSPALFAIEANDLRHMSVYNVEARVPFKLKIRDSQTLTVTQSSFETVPWPGFHIYNVTKASFTNNIFLDAAPKSLTAQTGK